MKMGAHVRPSREATGASPMFVPTGGVAKDRFQQSPVQTLSKRTITTPSGRLDLVQSRRIGQSEGMSLLPEHVVFMGLTGRSAPGEQQIDQGHKRKGIRPPGVVDIVPAGHRLHGWSGGAGQVTYVSAQFDPGLDAPGQGGAPAIGGIRPELGVSDPTLRCTMEKAAAAFDMPDVVQQLYSEALLRVLALELVVRSKGDAVPAPARGGLAPGPLRRACEAMEANLDAAISLGDLATLAGCSPAHFSRAFKQSTGLPPFAWLLERRIDRAKQLLACPKMPLAEVALAIGFSAQPQFTTAFRRITGLTPGTWRRNLDR